MRRTLPWAQAGAAGLALALAMPRPHVWPLAFVAPVLILSALGEGCGRRRGFLLGWTAGLVHWAVSTSWVVAVMHGFGGLPLAAALVCLVAMSALMGLFWAVPGLLTTLANPRLRVIAFPAAFIAFESLRRFPPLPFPWNPVANAFTGTPALLGSLPVWGASGFGWAVLAIGAGCCGLTGSKVRRLAFVQAGLAAGLVIVFSLAAPAPQPTGLEFEAAMVQPGTTLAERWQPSMWREVSERVVRLTRETGGADLVLWPEGSVPYVWETDAAYRRQVRTLAGELDTRIVLNSVAPSASGEVFNSAYLVSAGRASTTRYDKVRLVPFGEYVPVWARFAFTEALVREVASFSPGSAAVVMPEPAPFGVAICYEIIFPDIIAEQVRSGAEVLTTITNDGWYGFSWAPDQHFAQAVLRAIETRRWVLRAALTGISGAVDPSGRVVERLPVGASGVVRCTVAGMSGLTPRVRFGDWWAVLAGLVACGLAIHGVRRSGRMTGPENPRD